MLEPNDIENMVLVQIVGTNYRKNIRCVYSTDGMEALEDMKLSIPSTLTSLSPIEIGSFICGEDVWGKMAIATYLAAVGAG